MDLNKFTQKSLQAVQDCQKLAYQYGNQKIEQEHLLYSLLTIEDFDALALKKICELGFSGVRTGDSEAL